MAIVAINREGNHIRFVFDYDPGLLAAGLAPGQEVTLTGETGLYWHGNFDVLCADDSYDAAGCAMHDADSVWLMALADYCEGAGMAPYCAVKELDEMNNTQGPVILKKE